MQAFDIIVVGGGGSGLAAAASAAEHGASVLVLEKQLQLGGTTGIAVGSFTACGSKLQLRAGVQDKIEHHVEDVGRFAPEAIEPRNNAELRRFFLAQSAETLDWLMGMGLRFAGPHPEPPNRQPRMHNVVPGAKAYIATLHARLMRLGGQVLCGAPVVALMKEGDRVVGVVAMIDGSRQSFNARRGVVLAAGDYAGASDLITRFKGEEFAVVEGINPRATGDGHRLAEQAGAQLLNMDVTYGPELRFVPPPGRTWQQVLPVRGPLAWLLGLVLPYVPRLVLHALIRRLLVTWQHPEEALFHDGAILINSLGQRFCDETISPARELAVARQPGKLCYILLDERLADRYSRWPHFISTAPKIAYAYVADYLRLRRDIAVEAASLDDLARRRSLPAETLRETVTQATTRAKASGQPPLAGSRWILLGPAKAYFTTTEGGAAINQRFEVLDDTGRPIAGLYAVGQNGLGGQILWGHGLHIAWAITSGRLLGRQLSESVQ